MQIWLLREWNFAIHEGVENHFDHGLVAIDILKLWYVWYIWHFVAFLSLFVEVSLPNCFLQKSIVGFNCEKVVCIIKFSNCQRWNKILIYGSDIDAVQAKLLVIPKHSRSTALTHRHTHAYAATCTAGIYWCWQFSR